MREVIGVRFQKAGKIYYFSPNNMSLLIGDHVIVETQRGIEYGEVVLEPFLIREEILYSELREIIRKANESDTFIYQENKENAKIALEKCREKIAEHGLNMRVVSCEYTFDKNKIMFYFTADGRIDFRELVKDLAAIFKIRIELRQIGVRDKAKRMGGVGPCGQPCCCRRFLKDFQPVSIKMAKDQSLSLNPIKISGMCGRLMCCLNYEQKGYEEKLKRMPHVGEHACTKCGHKGCIVETNTLKESIKLRFRNEDDIEEVQEFPIDELKK